MILNEYMNYVSYAPMRNRMEKIVSDPNQSVSFCHEEGSIAQSFRMEVLT